MNHNHKHVIVKIKDNMLGWVGKDADKQYMKKGGCVFFLLLALACVICRAGDLVGEKAPDITIKGWVTDNPPDLRNLEGRVRVLDFWATWCGPCVSNIPHLINLCSKYKSMGVEFIALSQDKSADKVRKLAREKGMNYNVAIDNGTADWFKIRCYPTVVVIGHSGKVIWRGLPWESGFERAIDEAVAKAPSPLSQEPVSYPKTDLAGAEGGREIKTASVGTDKTQPSNIASQIIVSINQRIIAPAFGLAMMNLPMSAFDLQWQAARQELNTLTSI